jgi:MFS family permease
VAVKGATFNKRLYVLALSTATMLLVFGMPSMAMPVLFNEISADLGLSLVQVGSIWGFSALTGAIFGLVGGVAGDLRATRWVVGLACIGGGVIGASRGLSNGYLVLAVTTLLMGMVGGFVPMNIHKTVGYWFSARSFGKANSILSLGMGTGATIGSLISASLLSPWLGGWRHVTFLYGAISIAIGVLWVTSPEAPGSARAAERVRVVSDFREAYSRVLPLRGFWLIVLVGLFHGASIQGFTGYLPLYLTTGGWTRLGADSALSVFSAASVAGVVPVTILAERYGARRAVLMVTAFVTFAGLLLLAAFTGALVWPIMVAIGLLREVFMALTITMIVQTTGIGPKHAGTALGICFSLSGLARFASPPIGNSLARFGAGYPFIFWAALAGVAALLLFFVRSPKRAGPGEAAVPVAGAQW